MFPYFLTKKEVKALKLQYTTVTGGSVRSGNYYCQLGGWLEFPNPSIMGYVVCHHSSSAPLSKEDLQRVIRDANIFFIQQDIERHTRSIEFYQEKKKFEPETKIDSYFLKLVQEQNATDVKLLAELQSEAKAASEASRSAAASEASRSAAASEASRSADASYGAMSDVSLSLLFLIVLIELIIC
jgi:uncharacterized protein (DUF305 family)